MLDANQKSRPRLRRLREGCAAVACLVLAGISFGCHKTSEGALDPATVGRSWLPIDADPDLAEKVGREALAKIGYIPIMNLAREAGWITNKRTKGTARSDPAFLAQAADASGFIEVFSKYAVAAGVASQADSPLPGPGDAVAVGILVIGLVDAGLLAGAILTTLEDTATTAPSTSTAAPPTESAAPTAVPVPTVTAAPVARRETCELMYPNLRICSSLPDKYTFSSAKAALTRMKDAVGDKNLSLHNEEQTESGPCPGIGIHYNVRQGGKRAGSITCCPCCIDGLPSPKVSTLCRIVL